MPGMQPCRSTETGASAVGRLRQSPDSPTDMSQETGLGLQDRDYMHGDRSGRPRQHRQRAFRSLLWALCGAMFIAVVLLRTNAWWIARHQADPPDTSQRARLVAPPVVAPIEVTASPIEEGPTPRALPHPAGAAPSRYRPRTQTQVVYKCVVNGRVTYSGPDDCKGGTASTLDILPGPDSVAVPTARVAARREAARPVEQPMAQQIQAAADEAAQAVARAHDQQLAASRQAECRQLDDTVRNLDSQARQPSSGQTQDWIRSQRTDTRSRQFALHC